MPHNTNINGKCQIQKVIISMVMENEEMVFLPQDLILSCYPMVVDKEWIIPSMVTKDSSPPLLMIN